MGRITALRVDSSKKRVKVFVDGFSAFVIDEEVAVRADLRVDQYLSTAQIEELTQASLFQNCFDAALRYLSYRPRSEAEVRQRLHRRGFGNEVADRVMIELRRRGLVDDIAFARFWKDNRLLFSPRSRQLMKMELIQKGIATEITGEIIEDLDDEISAYEAGLKKARVLGALGYDEFCRRLSGYLRRRGFSYEVIDHVSARLWQEQQTSSE